MTTDSSARLSRRHIVASAVGGALFGSAWGLALGEASADDRMPVVTVVWSRSGFAALVEHRRRRILLLSSEEVERQRDLTQLVTGFTRQRIDVLLAPDATLQILSANMKDRWRLSRVMAADPDTAHPQVGVADRQIRIGDLAVRGRRIDSGAWRADGTPFSGWYLEVRYGDGLVAIVPEARVLQRLNEAKGTAMVVIVLDEHLEAIPPVLTGVTIAAPTDAAVFDVTDRDGDRLIRLFRDSPVSFGLPGSGVALPGGG